MVLLLNFMPITFNVLAVILTNCLGLPSSLLLMLGLLDRSLLLLSVFL